MVVSACVVALGPSPDRGSSRRSAARLAGRGLARTGGIRQGPRKCAALARADALRTLLFRLAKNLCRNGTAGRGQAVATNLRNPDTRASRCKRELPISRYPRNMGVARNNEFAHSDYLLDLSRRLHLPRRHARREMIGAPETFGWRRAPLAPIYWRSLRWGGAIRPSCITGVS